MSITKQFLKLLFVSTLIVIYSYAVSANNHRPIISVFSIKTPKLNLKFSEIMKNSVLHSLSEKNFLTQDGNKTYKYFDNNNFVRIDEVISNNAFKDRSDGELILFLKLDIINVNMHDYLLELGAEVYNLKSDNFLTSWTIPKKKILLPSNCDSICKNIKLTSNIVLASNQLGESLGNILKLNFRQKDNKNSFVKKYKFNISGLNTSEILSLTDIVVNEFPGFVKLIDKEQHGSNYKWIYYSSANNFKLKKWLNIALKQLDLKVGENIDLNVNSDFVVINKYPKNLSRGSKGDPKKFN